MLCPPCYLLLPFFLSILQSRSEDVKQEHAQALRRVTLLRTSRSRSVAVPLNARVSGIAACFWYLLEVAWRSAQQRTPVKSIFCIQKSHQSGPNRSNQAGTHEDVPLCSLTVATI